VASLVPTAAAAATLLEAAWYAADHIPGFHQSSIEQLALNSPYEHPASR
jgi:hypothetical protein